MGVGGEAIAAPPAHLPKMSSLVPSIARNEAAICTVLFIIGGLALFFARQKRIAPIDYFALTGVRAPVPLLDFNVDEAKARPYRPFRWEYHQTMSTAFASLRGDKVNARRFEEHGS